MKNITLALDEATLKAARIYAAEHDTTVNGLVREYLSGIAERRSVTVSGDRRVSEATSPKGLHEEASSMRRDDSHAPIGKRQFPADTDTARRAREELIELSKSSKAEVGPITWSRDEVHERGD